MPQEKGLATASEEAVPATCRYFEKFLLANSKQGFFIGDKVDKFFLYFFLFLPFNFLILIVCISVAKYHAILFCERCLNSFRFQQTWELNFTSRPLFFSLSRPFLSTSPLLPRGFSNVQGRVSFLQDGTTMGFRRRVHVEKYEFKLT